MKVKVSVVVPILNSIQYIEECIDSILAQSLSEIEVLMVDAGSTDGTLERLYEYEKQDSRCKLIQSELKSCGHQDNLGVENAVGEYVAFVESDDVIVPNMYEELFVQAKEHDLDYIKGDFDTFYYIRNGERISERFRGVPGQYYNQVIDASANPELVLYDMYLWKGIYKREFLIQNKIWQNTTRGAAFQDQGFLFQTISLAKRVMYTDKVYYQYRRDNSTSSVYNVNGYVYLKNEFLFIEKILESNPNVFNFWPYFYQRLSNMIQTRDKIMVYSEVEWTEVSESLAEIGKIFARGIEARRFSEKNIGEQRYVEIAMLIKDVDLYVRNAVFKHTLKKELWSKQISRCLQHKNIVIFGCSITNRRLFTILEKNNVGITAFCDNAEEKQCTKCCGIPVYKPEEVLRTLEDVVFLVPNKYEQTMSEQLEKSGVSKERIVSNDIGLDIAAAFVYQYNKR